MSLLDDRSFRIIGNGGVRTRFKTRNSADPTFKTKINYPRPIKSDETEKSPDNSKTRGLGAYWYW